MKRRNIWPKEKTQVVMRILSRQSSVNAEAELLQEDTKVIEQWVSDAEQAIHSEFRRQRGDEQSKQKLQSNFYRISAVIPASDLVDELSGEVVAQNMPPAVPGIYLWNHAFRPSRGSSNELLEWIDRAIRLPIARVSGSFGHFGRATLELGASKLDSSSSAPKREALVDFFSDKANREQFVGMLQEFDSSMVLYVGQTDNLERRTKQHLGPDGITSKFRAMDWELGEMSLQYIELPNSSEQLREAIERILAILLVAPLVERAG